MVVKLPRSQVVPLRVRTLAETVTILATAAKLKGPRAADRVRAGPYPVDGDERLVFASLYAAIRDPEARQALLDVMVAVVRNG